MSAANQAAEPARHRTLFLSDIHLGTRACQAEQLLEFLRQHQADTIYLVGDIVDFWNIRRRAYWPQSHNDVIQKLLRQVRKGTRLVFVPGNHDEVLRDYLGMRFGGIEFTDHCIHETADGRRILVTHGDAYDVVVRYARWLAHLGDSAYGLALWLNTHFNWVRRRLGKPYWSLSAYLKYKVKSAVNFIGEFEHALVSEARRRDAQGVVCGHIHHAAMRQLGDVLYMNAGDWVESCTALVESEAGEFEIIRWAGAGIAHLQNEPTSERQLRAAA